MKAHILKKLHERQCLVTELIINCDNRLSMCDQSLKRYEESKEYYIGVFPRNRIIGITKKNVAKYTSIKQRLIEYYKDIQIRIMTLQPEIELTTSTEMDLATQLS